MVALSALFMSLVLLSPHDLMAIDEQPPIIAVANNNIYAVSPLDGDARLLVERPAEKEQALQDIGVPRSLDLSRMSPDNTKFAYTAPLYEMLDPVFEDQTWPDFQGVRLRDLTLVDIASGQLTPITHQGDNLAEMVESDTLSVFKDLTWSVDGQRLYFMSAVVSMRNRVPQQMIEYYDLQAGERRVLVKLNPQANILGIYAVSQGLVLIDGSYFEGDFEFTLYGHDGSILNSLEMPLEGVMQCSNPMMFERNPVFVQDDYFYGYYTLDLGPAALLDVASGDTIPLEGELVPAFMSHTHTKTSLRVVGTNLCQLRDGDQWTVTDAEGHFLYSIELKYIDSESQMALSPDGESLAYLKYKSWDVFTPVPIIVTTPEGSHELDFAADEILWGAVDYTFVSVFDVGSGG